MADSVSQHIQRLIDEGLVGMAEAARWLGTLRAGTRCHPSTMTRYCLSGVRHPGGGKLRLEHVRIAGRLMTSKAALLRFLAAQQTNQPAPPPRSPAERDRDAAAAGRELEQLGA